jgi:hypothetical protein
MHQVDGEKIFNIFKERYAALIVDIHEYRWYQTREKRYAFDRTVIVMRNNCIIEFNQTYGEVMYDCNSQEFIDELTAMMRAFRQKQRKRPLEINLVVYERNTLQLKAMEIKRTKLDLDLFYEDDFKTIDEIVRCRLGKKTDKGIVLLHGLPGTGKTTYLRYLVGMIRKKVLYLSPGIAGNLRTRSLSNC